MKNILHLLTRPYLAVALLLMLGATAVMLSSLPASLGTLAPSPSKQIVYVSGHLGISIVDIHQGQQVDRIPVNGSVAQLELNRSGTHLYARVFTNTLPHNSIMVFDTANNQLLDTIPISETETSITYGAAVNPQETRLYVIRREYAGGPNTLRVIDIASRSEIASIPFEGVDPRSIAFSPSGAMVYVGIRGNNGLGSGIMFVDALNNTVITNLSVEGGLSDIVISPDGRQAYAALYSAAEVAVIDTANITVTARIVVSHAVQRMALNHDGTHLYVIGNGFTVRAIDTSTNTVTDNIWTPLGDDIDISASGDKLFMPVSGTNELWIVNTRQKRVDDIIQVDKDPWSVVAKP